MVEIKDEDFLLRRVPCTDPNYIKDDGSLTSFAFTPRKQDTDGLSVDIERLTTPAKSVLDRSKFRLFKLQAHFLKQVNLTCIHKPETDNYAHALIQGGFTRSICKKLASEAGKYPVNISNNDNS